MTILQYIGADDDRGGVISVIRALASAGRFQCLLGVNPGFQQRRPVPLATRAFSPVASETLGVQTFWRARQVAREVSTWLNAGPQRVFHSHSRAGLAVALWLARAGEKRVIATVHSYGRQRWFYRWAARRLGKRLFWLTPAMKRYYAVGDGWDQCMPGCLPAGLTLHSRRQHPTGRSVQFAGAGRIVPWKGWHLMIDALAGLAPAIKARVRFVHIGSTDRSNESERYAAYLRRRTVELGVADLVDWRGEQSSTEALMAESDCAVVLSDHEPFSMVMLEALAAGIPVLASAAGGPADILEPGVNGWLFEPGSVPALATAITSLVDTNQLERIRIEPEQLRRFSAAVVAESWAQVYAAVLDRDGVQI